MIVGRGAGTLWLLRESLAALAVLLAWDVAVVLIFQLFHQPWMNQPALPYSLIGSVLVLFMSVRNNAAYGRWWEARTLWGAVVNNTRSFARQTEALLGGRPDLVRAMIAYAHALRAGLQGRDPDPDLDRLLPAALHEPVGRVGNKAHAILLAIGREVARAAREQGLDGAEHAAIDRILSDLANAQGGLERILRTPLAIQFSVFPGLIARVFCVLLPLSMVQDLGWITPLGSTLIGFLFVSLDRIGKDLESPFADTVHALPMGAVVRTIEIDLLQSIGQPAPQPLRPEGGVLR